MGQKQRISYLKENANMFTTFRFHELGFMCLLILRVPIPEEEKRLT